MTATSPTDVLFLLLGAVMILAMHAGFAFLELGTVRGFVAQINLRASRPNPQTDLSHADRLRCAQGCKAI